jgi:hypothetical protein
MREFSFEKSLAEPNKAFRGEQKDYDKLKLSIGAFRQAACVGGARDARPHTVAKLSDKQRFAIEPFE